MMRPESGFTSPITEADIRKALDGISEPLQLAKQGGVDFLGHRKLLISCCGNPLYLSMRGSMAFCRRKGYEAAESVLFPAVSVAFIEAATIVRQPEK